jgi:hypothetical protein
VHFVGFLIESFIGWNKGYEPFIGDSFTEDVHIVFWEIGDVFDDVDVECEFGCSVEIFWVVVNAEGDISDIGSELFLDDNFIVVEIEEWV